MLIGLGLFTLIDADTPIAVTVPMQIIASIGFGFLWSTNFTVMAPLDPVHNASALSFLLFVRTFSSVSNTSLPSDPHCHLLNPTLRHRPGRLPYLAQSSRTSWTPISLWRSAKPSHLGAISLTAQSRRLPPSHPHFRPQFALLSLQASALCGACCSGSVGRAC